VILSPQDSSHPVLGGYVRGEFELGLVSNLKKKEIWITVVGDESKVSAKSWVYGLPYFHTQTNWFSSKKSPIKTLYFNLTLQLKEIHLYSVIDPFGRILKELTGDWRKKTQWGFQPRARWKVATRLVFSAVSFGSQVSSIWIKSLVKHSKIAQFVGRFTTPLNKNLQSDQSNLEEDPFFFCYLQLPF
jgi:hypothetical protein